VGASEPGSLPKRLKLSSKTSSEAGRRPSSFGRPLILAAAGLLGDLVGREQLVGRQRALDRQQPMQVLGQGTRQLERAPSTALIRDG
jgi:hypothetical protein